jgi:hypothetical protein
MDSSRARIDDHNRDVQYYEAHFQELLARYPNQWIAILDQNVVGASDDAFELMAQLEARGVSTNRVLRRHMAREAELLILTNL